MDLPPGKTRIKVGGGAAGHNGLRSIDGEIGEGYRRVRVGVGHPGRKDAVPYYVLHDFAKADARGSIRCSTPSPTTPAARRGQGPDIRQQLHAAAPPKDEGRPRMKPGRAKEAGQRGTPKKGTAAPRGEESGGDGPLAGALKKLFGR